MGIWGTSASLVLIWHCSTALSFPTASALRILDFGQWEGQERIDVFELRRTRREERNDVNEGDSSYTNPYSIPCALQIRSKTPSAYHRQSMPMTPSQGP